MELTFFTFVPVLVYSVLTLAGTPQAHPPYRGHLQPTVHLANASVTLRGISLLNSTVNAFLSIPYAVPPLSDLRFEPPVRITYSGKDRTVIEATSFGKVCTQFDANLVPNLFSEVVPEFEVNADVNGDGSGEDCLTVSVWTPDQTLSSKTAVKELLPVFVFLYGGGWYTGGANIPYQDPTRWVGRKGDVIVAVPNWRGDIFGFPNARGAKEQNLGILDQRLAIEWVRDNIRAFGGDPLRIILWGQSSGAEAVDIHSLAFPSDPIVSGLIMDSGTALIEEILGGINEPRYSNFTFVSQQVGCYVDNSTLSASEEFECMKRVDARAIENVLANDYANGSFNSLGFGVSADEQVMFANYSARVAEGKTANLPAIIGIDSNDGIAFAPFNISGPDQATGDYWTQDLFLCTAYRTSIIRTTSPLAPRAPTYRFLYNGSFPNISPLSWMGAYHQSELPLLFGTHSDYRGASTSFEVRVSEAMQDSWRAFAMDPWQGLERSVGWRSYDGKGGVVRTFAAVEDVVFEDGDGGEKYTDWEEECAVSSCEGWNCSPM